MSTKNDKPRVRKKKTDNPLFAYAGDEFGYVETGYTEQRLDREVTRGDRYLLELEEVAKIADDVDEGAEWFAVVAIRERLAKVLRDRGDEVKAARTRTKG